MTTALLIAVAALVALSIYLWRKPNMTIDELNAHIAKLTTDATAAAAKIAAQQTSIDSLTAAGTAKDAQIADLQVQLAAAQGGQDGVLQQISEGLDRIDAALPDA